MRVRALAPGLVNWEHYKNDAVVGFKTADPEGQIHAVEFNLAENVNLSRITHTIDGEPFEINDERMGKAVEIIMLH